MVVQVTYRGWNLANTPKEKVHGLKCVVLGILETWGLVFLGGFYGNEEVLLFIWIFLY
jgi:hypothetical protein